MFVLLWCISACVCVFAEAETPYSAGRLSCPRHVKEKRGGGGESETLLLWVQNCDIKSGCEAVAVPRITYILPLHGEGYSLTVETLELWWKDPGFFSLMLLVCVLLWQLLLARVAVLCATLTAVLSTSKCLEGRRHTGGDLIKLMCVTVQG